MKKAIGYVLIGAGIVALIASYNAVLVALNITLPEFLNKTTLLSLAALGIILGAFVAFRVGTNKKVTEVPIYHGKDVVGYRRVQR